MTILDGIDLSDPLLEFDSDSHTYRYRGVVQTSVTTLIKQYRQPFDSEFHAGRVAKRTGRTPETVRQEWEDSLDEAGELGTSVHERIEGMAESLLSGHGCGSTDLFVAGALRFLWDNRENFGGRVFEARVCDPEIKIAGTVDMLCEFGGENTLIDWKTNRDISCASPTKMLPPLHHMDDSALNHYVLQLNLYARLLKRYGINVCQYKVVWLNGRGGYEIIPLWSVSESIDRLLVDFLD